MSIQRFGIALCFIVGFFAVLAYMLYMSAPGTEMMIGVLVTTVPLMAKWYFDSSPGSEKKTDLLAKAGPIPEPAVPGTSSFSSTVTTTETKETP